MRCAVFATGRAGKERVCGAYPFAIRSWAGLVIRSHLVTLALICGEAVESVRYIFTVTDSNKTRAQCVLVRSHGSCGSSSHHSVKTGLKNMMLGSATLT